MKNKKQKMALTAILALAIVGIIAAIYLIFALNNGDDKYMNRAMIIGKEGRIWDDPESMPDGWRVIDDCADTGWMYDYDRTLDRSKRPTIGPTVCVVLYKNDNVTKAEYELYKDWGVLL